MDFYAFPVLRQDVACEIGIFAVSNFESQVVHWILELEELYVRLHPQPEGRHGTATQILRVKGGFCFAIKCLYVGPLQAHHVQRETLLTAYPLGIPPQPRFKPGPQIPQRERA